MLRRRCDDRSAVVSCSASWLPPGLGGRFCSGLRADLRTGGTVVVQVTAATKRFAPNPYGNDAFTGSYSWSPNQRNKNTLTFAPRCPGFWRFTVVLFQGGKQVSKSWADFTTQ